MESLNIIRYGLEKKNSHRYISMQLWIVAFYKGKKQGAKI